DRVKQSGFAVIDVAHDRNHGRTRRCLDCGFLSTSGSSIDVFRRLLFERNYIRVSAEEACHFAGEFRIECLVNRGEYAASQKARNQILGANVELLGKIFYADALRDRDIASDRHRLVRHHHARWRNVALHWTFFYPARNIALSWPACRRAGTTARTNRTGRRKAWTNSKWTRPSRSRACGIHGTALAGAKRRTRPSDSWRSLRSGTLENRLTRNGSSWRGTHRSHGSSCLGSWGRRSRTRWRGLIDWA